MNFATKMWLFGLCATYSVLIAANQPRHQTPIAAEVSRDVR